MRKSLLLAVVGASLSATSQAEEMSLDYEATIIGAALDDQGQAEAESFLYDLMLGIENDHLFDNGLELGFRLGGRVQQDHAQRPGFAGNFQSSVCDSKPCRR